MRRLILLALVFGVLAIPVPTAAAEVHVPFCGIDPNTLTGGIPNCSFTTTSHGITTVDPANVNPCSGIAGTATMVTNSITHVTVNGAGDVWVTSTSTAHFTFVPNPPNQTTPSYAGQMTFWFGASLNKNNVVFHDTGNIVVHGTDGSKITFHLLDHFNTSASGAVNTFSVMSATCP
jgi:hypothetical protein